MQFTTAEEIRKEIKYAASIGKNLYLRVEEATGQCWIRVVAASMKKGVICVNTLSHRCVYVIHENSVLDVR